MSKRGMIIRIVKGKAGPHLQLVGGNGEIIMAGEVLKRISSAHRTADRILAAMDDGLVRVEDRTKAKR